MRALIGRTDGACRGNPGPASIGVALYDASRNGADHPSAQPDATISAAIGTTTNNVAEWKAVISAIELAAELASLGVIPRLQRAVKLVKIAEVFCHAVFLFQRQRGDRRKVFAQRKGLHEPL